jgi:hypothetical protein
MWGGNSKFIKNFDISFEMANQEDCGRDEKIRQHAMDCILW